MPSKKTRYTRLETDPESSDSDEAPPTHVHSSQNFKGSRWNHIENLDEFYEWVYQYLMNHGWLAILLNDTLELFQFAFMCIFSAFIITCLNFKNLLADKVYTVDNNTKDVELKDVIDINRLNNIHPLLVLILLLAFVFWFHRLCKTIWRAWKFWEIKAFYLEVLGIGSADLRNYNWIDVLQNLKSAQTHYKMNIRKQELTELDVYHRILRFKNYMVAMINKNVLTHKIWIPFYGEKVFFTMGLKYNYELLLFWGPGAPFKNNYHLHEQYKLAAKKHVLAQKMRFRITVLALINLIFLPLIFLYQIMYSFFSYAELLKRQPGAFGRRRWSLFGRQFLRHFNELDHELIVRLNRAYIPAVKYTDLFVKPVVAILSRNIAFVSGSLLAVLFTLTVIQEDLLTAHNVLTSITLLGVIVTLCRIFIPNEHERRDPKELMNEILQEIHYMPDLWKDKPHTLQVSSQFGQVFQLTLLYLLDELLSPIITPFILFFSLRNRSLDIIEFLRNFTIDVSGVGDVCSFAEMDLRKHGDPNWHTSQLTHSTEYERAELGKTELSLIHFAHNNPDWDAGDDANLFMTQTKESFEDFNTSLAQRSSSSQTIMQDASQTIMQDASQTIMQDATPGQVTERTTETRLSTVLLDSMSTSIWASTITTDSSSLNPVHLHRVHDISQKLKSSSSSYHPPPSEEATLTIYDQSDSSLSSADVRLESSGQHVEETVLNLQEPLLSHVTSDLPSTLQSNK